MARPSVLIFGAGAVGGYLAASVPVSANVDVVMLAREPIAEAVRSSGLRLIEDSTSTVVQPRVFTSVEDCPLCDVCALTIRAYDVAGAIPQLSHLVKPESGVIIPFQNGVGTDALLTDHFGSDSVIAATLTSSVGMDEPGVVRCYSRAGGVALASMDGNSIPAWVKGLFPPPVKTIGDPRSLRWSKLLLNMIGAASSAILDVDMSVLMNDRRLFRIEQLALREAGAVMKAGGIEIVSLPGYPVTKAEAVMRLPLRLAHFLLARRISGARGGHSPTMRADMVRGRSEVEYLNGAIAQAGSRLGVPTPVNQTLTDVVLELLEQPQRRSQYQAKPDRLVARMRAVGIRL